MERFFLWAAIAVGLASSYAAAEIKQPDDKMRKTLRINYQKRINPGIEVPKYPEYYAWVITGRINGEQVYEGEVPVLAFDYGNIRVLGKVPVGTAITLESFEALQGRIYYGIPFADSTGKPQKGYVDGSVIERDDANSFAPGK